MMSLNPESATGLSVSPLDCAVLLSTIANRMYTLRTLASDTLDAPERVDLETFAMLVQTLAETSGALADSALSAKTLGGVAQWSAGLSPR